MKICMTHIVTRVCLYDRRKKEGREGVKEDRKEGKKVLISRGSVN